MNKGPSALNIDSLRDMAKRQFFHRVMARKWFFHNGHKIRYLYPKC